MIKLNQRLLGFMSSALCCFFSTLISPSALAEQGQQPTIAIIIDDMGNQYENGVKLARLPYPITLSFLPERPHTLELIQLAVQNDKEIMLHSPMENTLGFELGYGGLTKSMGEWKIKNSLESCFKDIPNMVGINNHMGSKLTTNPVAMRWVMETVSQHPFFFVDSRTTPDTVAAKVANSFRIPNLSRDIFLDHEQSRKFIQIQFLKLLEIARKTGTAVAIAHPHRSTVEYLTRALSKLDEKGISIATVSALWQIRHPGETMAQYAKSTRHYARSIVQRQEGNENKPGVTTPYSL